MDYEKMYEIFVRRGWPERVARIYTGAPRPPLKLHFVLYREPVIDNLAETHVHVKS